MLYYSHDTMEVGRAAEAVQLPESGVPAQASKGFVSTIETTGDIFV